MESVCVLCIARIQPVRHAVPDLFTDAHPAIILEIRLDEVPILKERAHRMTPETQK